MGCQCRIDYCYLVFSHLLSLSYLVSIWQIYIMIAPQCIYDIENVFRQKHWKWSVFTPSQLSDIWLEIQVSLLRLWKTHFAPVADTAHICMRYSCLHLKGTSLCSYSGVTWFVTLQKVKYLNNWLLFFMANCAFSLDAMRCCYSSNMKIVLFYLFCENEVGCIRWLVVHLRWDAVGEKELTRLNETPDLSASAKPPR